MRIKLAKFANSQGSTFAKYFSYSPLLYSVRFKTQLFERECFLTSVISNFARPEHSQSQLIREGLVFGFAGCSLFKLLQNRGELAEFVLDEREKERERDEMRCSHIISR